MGVGAAGLRGDLRGLEGGPRAAGSLAGLPACAARTRSLGTRGADGVVAGAVAAAVLGQCEWRAAAVAAAADLGLHGHEGAWQMSLQLLLLLHFGRG